MGGNKHLLLTTTTSSLFNPIAALAPHLLSHLADHSHHLHYKSPTTLFDVLHPICGVSLLLHFVSLVPVILWIHSSSHMSHLCHPSLHFHHPLLLHSFTIHLKPTYSKNPSHHSLFFLPGLPQRTRTRTGLSASWFLFLFLFFYLCVKCDRLSYQGIRHIASGQLTLLFVIIVIVISG